MVESCAYIHDSEDQVIVGTSVYFNKKNESAKKFGMQSSPISIQSEDMFKHR